MNREVAVGMLELLGYEVAVAENGRQALMLAECHAFDVVLMDCQMPEWTVLQQPVKFAAEKRHPVDTDSPSSR